jgi:hypothetical protein
MKIVVSVNPDTTEVCMMTRMQWDIPDYKGEPIVHRDADGRSMRIIHEFEASSWADACVVHKYNLDTGFYEGMV